MNITLEGMDYPLRGDLVQYLVLRTDLTPIPSTVEALIRADEQSSKYLTQGKEIVVGGASYKIILSSTTIPTGKVGGNSSYKLVKIIALLKGVYELAFIKDKAIIKEKTSFAQVIRKCGATFSTGKDIHLDKFTCLIGEYPSYSIMRALGRNGAVMKWDLANKIEFIRLRDLFDQTPKFVMNRDETYSLESGFIEKHQIPAYFSNGDNGAIIGNNANKKRCANFEMFASSQILNNLSTYLVNRKVWTTPLSPQFNAGDVIEIEGEKLIIVTATHALAKPESGQNLQMSRFWLATLSTILDKTQ